jgi:purine-binding chemotaxis protein CheW
MPEISTRETQVVVFAMGEEEYGIDIEKVQSIMRLPETTMLPGTADYVLGIFNLRGDIIPVVDLKKMSMGVASVATEETRVIVVEIGSHRVGLIVDEVAEVVKVPADVIVSAGSIGTTISADYLLGIARLGERLLILLNVDRLLS